MLLGREAVDLRERVVHAQVAQVAVPEADRDGRGDEQRVEPRVRRLHLRVQARVLDAERDPRRDVRREGQVVLAVAPAGLAGSERERADRAAAGDERGDEVRARLEALVELEVVLVARGIRECRLVGDRDQERLSGRQHHRRRVLRVAVGWVLGPDGAEQLLLLRIHVAEHRLAQRRALLDEIDDAVVGERGDDHVAEPRQRLLEVEGRGEDVARLGEEAHALARPQLVRDVVEGVDRHLDGAVLVAHRRRSHHRPALLARRPDAITDGPLRGRPRADRDPSRQLVERQRRPLLVQQLEPRQQLLERSLEQLLRGCEADQLRGCVVRVHEPPRRVLGGDPVRQAAEHGLELGAGLDELPLGPLALRRGGDVVRHRHRELELPGAEVVRL